MKKIITTTMLLFATLCMTAQGNQKIIDVDNDDFYLHATHPEFSYNGASQLYSRNDYNETDSYTYYFYDDNLDKQREWTIPGIRVNYYTQTFAPEITYNWEQDGDDTETMLLNSSSDQISIETVREYINYYYSDEFEIVKEETTEYGTFFYCVYIDDELQYPECWFWLSPNGLVLKKVWRHYTVTPIIGNNYVAGEKNEHSKTFSPYSIYLSDYDSPYEVEANLRFTQTLFNDDEKFEYIMPLVTDGLSNIYTGEDYDYDNNTYIPYVVKTYGAREIGFQIVNEDGTVVQTVYYDGNFIGSTFNEASIYRIHGKMYLAFSGQILDEANNSARDASLIYTIDPKTTGIKKVREQVGNISVYPRVADRSENITVELTGDGGIREVRVVNAAGKTKMRVPVKAGQKHVTIPASELSRGMNVVNAVGGKNNQAHKVIVK